MAKQRLVIGLFLEHYDPFVSGVITATKALKQELSRRGHKVYIVCPRVRGHRDQDPDVIRYRSISLSALQNTTIGLPLPSDVRRLAKLKFDIVHSQEIFYSGGLALSVAKRLDVPFVQHFHTLWNRFLDQYRFPLYVYLAGMLTALFYYPLTFGLRPLLRLFFGRTTRRFGRTFMARAMWRHMLNLGEAADLVISPSEHLLKSLKAAKLKAETSLLPNGIAPLSRHQKPLLGPTPSGRLRVLSVARLSPEKRVEVLIESAAGSPNVELLVVGIGPTEKSLKSLVENLKLTKRVHFFGELDNASVRQLMEEADLLALASYNFDNQPVVFGEALAGGLPIVYCDSKLREGLTAKNSFLAEKTADGFSRAFKALAPPAKRQAMGRASRQLAAQFDVSVTAGQLIKLYNKVIDEHQAKTA